MKNSVVPYRRTQDFYNGGGAHWVDLGNFQNGPSHGVWETEISVQFLTSSSRKCRI